LGLRLRWRVIAEQKYPIVARGLFSCEPDLTARLRTG
jgi:hypothetical protein